jgi:hypothetical protein
MPRLTQKVVTLRRIKGDKILSFKIELVNRSGLAPLPDRSELNGLAFDWRRLAQISQDGNENID